MPTRVVTYDDLAQTIGLYDATVEGAAIAVQNVLDFNEITNTTVQITTDDVVTSITITPVDFVVVTKGKKITVYFQGDAENPSRVQQFIAAQDYIINDSVINVESDTALHTFPVGSSILILGSQQQKYLTYTEKAIELGVKTWSNLTDENNELVTDENGDPLYAVEGDSDSQLEYLHSQIQILNNEIELRVTAGEVYASINLGVLIDDLGQAQSFIDMVADVINLDGLVTITNFDEAELLKKWVFNQNEAPTERPNTMPLQVGDLWWDLDGGNMPYLWNGTEWVLAATQIDGGSITTGYINAARIEAGSIDGTKITAGTITADRITVSELSALAADMGSLNINDILTIAEGGRIFNEDSYSLKDSGLYLYSNIGGKRPPGNTLNKTSITWNFSLDLEEEPYVDTAKISAYITGGVVTAANANLDIGAGYNSTANQYQGKINLLADDIISTATFVNFTDASLLISELQTSGLVLDGPIRRSVKDVSANYTALLTDNIINCSANSFNITLPSNGDASTIEYLIVNSGTGVITIIPDGSDTIVGETNFKLYNLECITIKSYGTNWIAIGY